MTRTWHNSRSVNPDHLNLPIRQIYIWVITSDRHVVIVGKKDKFQFPGGKPEQGETRTHTITRELFEETGLELEALQAEPEFFGYYLIEDNPGWQDPQYLQLRYLLSTPLNSDQLDFSINEKETDIDQVETAKTVPLKKLPEFIPWTRGLEEYERHLMKTTGVDYTC